MDGENGIPDVIKGRIRPVEILTDLSKLATECKRSMAMNRPLLIKGAANDWEASRKWSLAYFRDGWMGSTLVDVSLDGREGGQKQRQPLRDYIASFTCPPPDAAGKQAPRFVPYMRYLRECVDPSIPAPLLTRTLLTRASLRVSARF